MTICVAGNVGKIHHFSRQNPLFLMKSSSFLIQNSSFLLKFQNVSTIVDSQAICVTGNSSQAWAKPLGNSSHAVFFISTGPVPAAFFHSVTCKHQTGQPWTSCVDLWTSCVDLSAISTRKRERFPLKNVDLITKETGAVDATGALEVSVEVHDSTFYCVRPAVGGDCTGAGGCPAYIYLA